MGVEIKDFRKYKKNTLKGFLTARLTSVSLEIRDIALHEKNGQRWIQLPAKPYDKPDGSTGWNYIVSFYEKDKHHKFQEMTLKAFDNFLCNSRGTSETATN